LDVRDWFMLSRRLNATLQDVKVLVMSSSNVGGDKLAMSQTRKSAAEEGTSKNNDADGGEVTGGEVQVLFWVRRGSRQEGLLGKTAVDGELAGGSRLVSYTGLLESEENRSRSRSSAVRGWTRLRQLLFDTVSSSEVGGVMAFCISASDTPTSTKSFRKILFSSKTARALLCSSMLAWTPFLSYSASRASREATYSRLRSLDLR